MNLLHVTPSFYPAHLYGGPVVSLHRLACAQVQLGVPVCVLTSDADGPRRRLARLSGCYTEEHGVPTYYARTLGLGGRLQDFSPELALRLRHSLGWADLVHVTALFSPSSLLALAAAHARKKKVVLSPRGALLPHALQQRPDKQALLALLRPLLSRVAGWHVTSTEEGRALAALGCAAPGRPIAVIENGIDLAEFDGADRSVLARLRVPGEGPIVTMLGRIDPIKGIDLALQALRELRREHPRALLLLAGPDRDGHGAALRKEAGRLGIADAVRFAGLVVGTEKAGLLRGSDLLWLCSRMESFGNVVLESLAAGTPVVAVHSTPWRTLEEEGVGRWVAPAPEAIAQASSHLLAELSKGSAPELRARCRAAVGERHSWPAIAQRMSSFYAEALGG